MTDRELFRLSLLYTPFQPIVREIVSRMLARGFREPYIGSTQRTEEEQLEALKRGTTGRNQRLTWHFRFDNKKTGEHGARAVDFRDRLPSGKPDKTTRNEPFFRALYEEATDLGCRSLAYEKDAHGLVKKYINGGKLWDAGHVEYRHPYTTLLEAVKAECPDMTGDEAPGHDPDDVVPEPLPLGELPPSPF